MSKFDFLVPRFAELRAWLTANGCQPLPGFELPFEVQPLDDEFFQLDFRWGALGTDPNQGALRVAHKCLEIMAHGYKTYIRHAPSAHTYTDFATDVIMTTSRVRFFIYPEEGDWTYPKVVRD